MTGFLNIDKPAGLTSFAVVKRVKNALPKMKIGHLGTLDPMVTGVLPLALGSATRLIEWIGDNSKTYRATMVLGAVSDTEDRWGTLQPTGKTDCTLAALLDALESYRGEIFQVPPMYSAVHHQGKRLYELARQGVEVARKERKVSIAALTLRDFFLDADGRRNVSLEIDCSAGTYIRTLCHDLGQTLETGAYLTALERVRWGPFHLENSLPLAEIANWQEHLISAACVVHLPQYRLTEAESQEITQGRAIIAGGFDRLQSGYVLLLDRKGIPLAVAEQTGKNILQPRKVLHSFG